mgnify:CR=1 FL=1
MVSAGEAAQAVAEAQSSFLAIGLVIGLVVGLLVGFVLGTRARKMLQALGMVPSVVKDILMARAAAMAAAADVGEAETAVAEPKLDFDEKPAVENFLNAMATPGLDDHPHLEFNPIILYKIKLAKEAMRIQNRREALEAEGFSPEEIASLLAGNATAGGVSAGDMPIRKNALLTLIENGARITPVKTSMNADDRVMEDRRRQLRTIDSYLSKSLEVDASKQAPFIPKGRQLGNSLMVEEQKVSALERARQTANTPVSAMGENVQLAREMTRMARIARKQLREIQRIRPMAIIMSSVPDADFEAAAGQAHQRRGGADSHLNLSDLESIQQGADEMQSRATEDGQVHTWAAHDEPLDSVPPDLGA